MFTLICVADPKKYFVDKKIYKNSLPVQVLRNKWHNQLFACSNVKSDFFTLDLFLK